MSVLFKTDETVKSIARQRFGYGSSNIAYYVDEHVSRREEFFRLLDRGLICREVYARDELEHYVHTRRHGPLVEISRAQMNASLDRWAECIRKYPNYMVAIVDEPLPFKYAVVDREYVVLHQVVSGNDSDRLNAIAIRDRGVATRFANDFDTVWNRSRAEFRDPNNLTIFIENLKE